MSVVINRVKAVDFIRGIAVVAAVVCHQQYLLHTSEWIQFISIYSVTSLVCMMGYTKGLSIEKFVHSKSKDSFLLYSLKKICPVYLSYVFASIVIGYYVRYDINTIWENIINYSMSSPFYFIRYFIILSLWAPVVYFFLVRIASTDRKSIRNIKYIIFLLGVYVMGYWSFVNCNILGASYMFVYSCGMLLSIVKLPKVNWKTVLGSIALLVSGIGLGAGFFFKGNEIYGRTLSFVVPVYGINPPNIFVILYSFSIMFFAYNIVCVLDTRKIGGFFVKAFCILGKYSLDIFIWHLFIQSILNERYYFMEQGVKKTVIYYWAMLLIPICGRMMWNFIKKRMYQMKNSF